MWRCCCFRRWLLLPSLATCSTVTTGTAVLPKDSAGHEQRGASRRLGACTSDLPALSVRVSHVSNIFFFFFSATSPVGVACLRVTGGGRLLPFIHSGVVVVLSSRRFPYELVFVVRGD